LKFNFSERTVVLLHRHDARGAHKVTDEDASCADSTGKLITGCPTGSFRNDPNGWAGYVPAARFTASIPFP
jgi:hypothetical protein